MLFPHGKILVCCPDHFEVSYEINPWMKKTVNPDRKKSWTQWKNLHHTLLRLGAWVEYVEQPKGVPDLVFTANAGLVRNNRCVLSHFRYKERQIEEPIYKKWFEDHGFEVFEIKDACFEGEGDALFAGNILFAGTGFRSDAGSHKQIADHLKIDLIVECELINPHFYHLDTCFCPLDSESAFYYPGAFSEKSRAEMAKHLKLIEVNEKEANKFACNSVVLGKDIVMPAGCPEICKTLTKMGYTPYEVELDEFIKAGGASKCLTLKLDQ
jgi:N-dimethylarginine dimethylaminohydrolase